MCVSTVAKNHVGFLNQSSSSFMFTLRLPVIVLNASANQMSASASGELWELLSLCWIGYSTATSLSDQNVSCQDGCAHLCHVCSNTLGPLSRHLHCATFQNGKNPKQKSRLTAKLRMYRIWVCFLRSLIGLPPWLRWRPSLDVSEQMKPAQKLQSGYK